MFKYIIVGLLCTCSIVASSSSLQFKLNVNSDLPKASKSFDFLDDNLYYFDYTQNIVKIYDKDHRLANSYKIDTSKLERFIPFSDFKITAENQLFLVGRDKRSLFLVDILSGKTREVAARDSKNDVFFKISSLFKWNKFLMAQDSFSKSFQIFSSKANYLSTIEYDFNYVLPFGFDQLLSVEDKVGYSIIEKVALDHSKSLFYVCEKTSADSFVSVYFLGYDKSNNVYLEKLYVNENSSKEIAILKLSPRGKKLKEKRFVIDDLSFSNLDKTFLVSPSSVIYQLKILSKSKRVSLTQVQF